MRNGKDTLYWRLGGEAFLAIAAERICRRLLRDPQLAPRFNGVEVARLRAQQHALLGQMTGRPLFPGGGEVAPSTPECPRIEGLEEHIAAALASLGVADSLIGEVLSCITPAGCHAPPASTSPN